MIEDVVYSSAYITSYAGRYMLNRERVRAMLAAPTIFTAAQVLAECGYSTLEGTDDDILDTERAKTFKMFNELCTDSALAACVKAHYDFTMTEHNQKYTDQEKELYKTISENYPNIKCGDIRDYFHAFAEALNKHQKLSTDSLYKYAENSKNDLETMGPLFHWYLMKQTEFKVVKTILMGKRFEFKREVITDDLRGLHEKLG